MIVEYEIQEDIPIIHVWYRIGIKKHHKVITNFLPYFYVPTEEFAKYDGVVSTEEGYISLFGKKLNKVFYASPIYSRNLKEKFTTTFEADLLFTTRYIIDEEPESGDLPKILYIDIEVLAPKGNFPEPEEAKYPIVSIALTSNYTYKYTILFLGKTTYKDEDADIYCFDREEDLLNYFGRVLEIENTDILTGWNTNNFDVPYIINRFNRLGLNPNTLSILNYVFAPRSRINERTGKTETFTPLIKGLSLFDLLPAYKKMNISELESNSLANVAEKELAESKLAYEGDLSGLYINNPNKFIAYNKKDVELCKKLDIKIGIIAYFFNLAKFIGCSIEDTLSNSRMGDIFILRHMKHNRRLILPTKTHTIAETFEGAIVHEPITGLHKNIIVLDLKKIYPSIIISANMSPETISTTGDIDLGNGIKFNSKPIGFTPEILKKLFSIRDEKSNAKKVFKYGSAEYDRAQLAEQFVKDLINSIYGLLSYRGFRLYAPDIGSSITYLGRKVNMWCKQKIIDKGYEVIYGDTDSVFIKAKTENFVSEGLELQDYINSTLTEFAEQFNIHQHIFSIAFDKVYSSLFFGIKDLKTMQAGKKRYAGMLVYKDQQIVNKLEIKGIETKRSDNSIFTKNIIKEILTMILTFKKEQEIKNYIETQILTYKHLPLTTIGIRKGISQNISEYKVLSAMLRGAVYVNTNFKTNYNKGSKPMYFYVKRINLTNKRKYPDTDVISFEEEKDIPTDFWKEFIINYEVMIARDLLNKIHKIYKSIGFSFIKLNITSQKNLLGFI